MKTKIFNIIFIALLLCFTIINLIFNPFKEYPFALFSFYLVAFFYLLIIQIRNFQDAQIIADITKKLKEYLQDKSLSNFDKKLHDNNLNHYVYAVDKTIHYLHNKIENKKRFNANIAHEIRKPLTLLRNEIEIGFFNTHQGFIKNIMEKIQELEDISKQLLLLSNENDATIKHNMQRVYLHTIFQKVMTAKKEEIKKKSINLVNDTSVVIPIHANDVLLKFAFANLLDNAIKYTESGGKVMISIKKKRKFIYCILEDNGYGIDKDEQKLIFHPFYRAVNHDKAIEGYGIGLALAYTIFELHHIECKIRSRKNKGTLILLKIPY